MEKLKQLDGIQNEDDKLHYLNNQLSFYFSHLKGTYTNIYIYIFTNEINL